MTKGCKYIAIALMPGQAIETCPYKDFEELPTQEQVAAFYKENPKAREVIVRVVSSYGSPLADKISIDVTKDN
jgi:hypothetical protein